MCMKDTLKQIKYINSEIDIIQRHIDNIEPSMCIDKVTGSDPVFPYTARSFQLEGADIDEYNRRVSKLRSRLIKKRAELLGLKEETQDFIDGIQDSLVRQIITLRYIDCYSWSGIAKKIGCNNTADGVRKISERFLKNY